MIAGTSPSCDPSGLVRGARQVPSPNCDDRPAGCEIDLLVIHCISLPEGTYGGDAVEALFTNRLAADAHPSFAEIAPLRVSAHLFIRRDGELIQFVPLHRRAWHAGVSCHQGRECCNDFSIGIELEGTDRDAFTDLQYQVLGALTRQLMARYPGIRPGRIVGHSEIAPERKTDPGSGFDWTRYHAHLESRPVEKPT